MAHILVVEDDHRFRQMLVTALGFEGHTVSEAKNGNEAAKVLQTAKIDLIITDILMPERDGIETLIALRKKQNGPPVVAMTGLSDQSALYLKIAQALGAQRTLVKPFELSELLRVLNEVLPPKKPPGR